MRDILGPPRDEPRAEMFPWLGPVPPIPALPSPTPAAVAPPVQRGGRGPREQFNIHLSVNLCAMLNGATSHRQRNVDGLR